MFNILQGSSEPRKNVKTLNSLGMLSLSVCLSVGSSVGLSVCLSVCLSLCLSLPPSFFHFLTLSLSCSRFLFVHASLRMYSKCCNSEECRAHSVQATADSSRLFGGGGCCLLCSVVSFPLRWSLVLGAKLGCLGRCAFRRFNSSYHFRDHCVDVCRWPTLKVM